MPLTIDLEKLPTHWRLGLSGGLDLSSSRQFRDFATNVLAQVPPAVILDLSGVDYLDSSGLGLLLLLNKEYESPEHLLVLIASTAVDKILTITRLVDFFTIAPDSARALEMVGG